MTARQEVSYTPRRCTVFDRDVWAILIREGEPPARVVNCLDTDHPCYAQSCAFTTDGGAWPFVHPVPQPMGREPSS